MPQLDPLIFTALLLITLNLIIFIYFINIVEFFVSTTITATEKEGGFYYIYSNIIFYFFNRIILAILMFYLFFFNILPYGLFYNFDSTYTIYLIILCYSIIVFSYLPDLYRAGVVKIRELVDYFTRMIIVIHDKIKKFFFKFPILLSITNRIHRCFTILLFFLFPILSIFFLLYLGELVVQSFFHNYLFLSASETSIEEALKKTIPVQVDSLLTSFPSEKGKNGAIILYSSDTLPISKEKGGGGNSDSLVSIGCVIGVLVVITCLCYFSGNPPPWRWE